MASAALAAARGGAGGLGAGKAGGDVGQKKKCSFLKKEPKNFCSLAYAVHVDMRRVSQRAKFFWFFFSKNNIFLGGADCYMLLYDFLAQPKWRSNEDFNTKDTTEGKAAKTTKKKKVERLAVGSARFPSRLLLSL